MRIRSSPIPHNAVRKLARISTTFVGVALIAACADPTNPAGLKPGAAVSTNGVPFAADLVSPLSPVWQQTARTYVATAGFIPVRAGHAYPLLGVAQYLAVQRAEASLGVADVEAANAAGNNAGGRARVETVRGAVAGASAVVLSYLFPSPAQIQAFEDMVTAQANAGPGQPHPGFTAGEAIGRAAGAEIVNRARADHFTDPMPVTARPPIEAGYWTSNTDPFTMNGGQMPGVTPWFLTSASQFRPGPPPAFGSDEFNAALADIRYFSDHPTAEHTFIAGFWALGAGTPTASGFWLERASEEIASHGLSERQATHLYALLSATMADATIGCWEAKEYYWLIRPWKADTHIVPLASVGKPNHPSYPSGHSCVSSSAGEVLSTWFPERRAHFESMVEEAGLSREVGGIHYHFDIIAGRDLGHNVAAWAIAQDASGTSILTAH